MIQSRELGSSSAKGRRSWLPLALGALAAFAVAAIGGSMTDVGPWYQALEKPSWKPPDWAFAPIWTVIFALAALSVANAWWAVRNRGARAAIVILFLLTGILNIAWSALFFSLKRPDWSLFEVVFLWAAVATLIVMLWRRARIAALLLVPYLLWVSIAAFLNLEIVRLNQPFG